MAANSGEEGWQHPPPGFRCTPSATPFSEYSKRLRAGFGLSLTGHSLSETAGHRLGQRRGKDVVSGQEHRDVVKIHRSNLAPPGSVPKMHNLAVARGKDPYMNIDLLRAS